MCKECVIDFIWLVRINISTSSALVKDITTTLPFGSEIKHTPPLSVPGITKKIKD